MTLDGGGKFPREVGDGEYRDVAKKSLLLESYILAQFLDSPLLTPLL